MSTRFKIKEATLPSVKVIQRMPISDARGQFERLFCEEELDLSQAGISIKQINRSLTRARGVVRGMHFQRPPYAELKIVSCLRGAIFDVAVDLRARSPTKLQWHGEVLSDENQLSMLIPPGFAHGFQTLSDDCELLYLHSAPYTPEAEDGINSLDPALGIAWPEPVTFRSERDRALQDFGPQFEELPA